MTVGMGMGVIASSPLTLGMVTGVVVIVVVGGHVNDAGDVGGRIVTSLLGMGVWGALVVRWSWSWSVSSLGAIVVVLVMAAATAVVVVIADGGGWYCCHRLLSMVGLLSPSLMVVVASTMLVMEVGRYVVKW